MRCPRCSGCLIPTLDEYMLLACINCGYRLVQPPPEPQRDPYWRKEKKAGA